MAIMMQSLLRGKHYTKMTEIKPTDILVGKGRMCTNHIGTIAFKVMVNLNLTVYVNQPLGSSGKSLLILELVEAIRDRGGRFLRETKRNSGTWFEISDKDARERFRNAFRDAMKGQRKEGPDASVSVCIDKRDSFVDVVSKLSKDPQVIQRLLKASENSKPRTAAAKKKHQEASVEATNFRLPFLQSPPFNRGWGPRVLPTGSPYVAGLTPSTLPTSTTQIAPTPSDAASPPIPSKKSCPICMIDLTLSDRSQECGFKRVASCRPPRLLDAVHAHTLHLDDTITPFELCDTLGLDQVGDIVDNADYIIELLNEGE